MSGLLLEALLALVILVLIVWWTMFSGRPGGEIPPADEPPRDGAGTAASPPSSTAKD